MPLCCSEAEKQYFLVLNTLIKKHEVSREAYTAYNRRPAKPKKPLKTTGGSFLTRFLELCVSEGEHRLSTESYRMCAQ